MPRSGPGTYSLPATYEAISGETIEAQQHNDPLEDLEQDANAARPIIAGGTGATTAVGANDKLNTTSSNIASATTTNLATATGVVVNITGTTTITGFGTCDSGVERVLIFAGILTLTHHATSLILPGAANITTAAGDVATMRSLGSGNWKCVGYQSSAGILQNASQSAAGIAELATAAEVRDGTAGKIIDPAILATAGAIVSLTDAATVAVDWNTFINADVTLTASRALGNPTNVQVGTFRTITVKGNNSTDRTLTFGSNYEGDIPTLTDIDDGKWYMLTLFALTATHIVLTSVTALKP